MAAPVRLSQVSWADVQTEAVRLVGRTHVRIVSEPKWDSTEFTYRNGDKAGRTGVRYRLTIPVEVIELIESSDDPDAQPIKAGMRAFPEITFNDELTEAAQRQISRAALAMGHAVFMDAGKPKGDGSVFESDNPEDSFSGTVSGLIGDEFELRGTLGDTRVYYTADGAEVSTRDIRYGFYPLKS